MDEEVLKNYALIEAQRGLDFALNKLDIFDCPDDLTEDQQETYWSYLYESNLKVVYVD